ncbi:MAG: hypothetical protein ACYCOO_12275, partial [Chitinophagaceae bacterium]
ILIILGCAGVILSFLRDYFSFLVHVQRPGVAPLSLSGIFKVSTPFIPHQFSWGIFWTGEGLILLGIGLLVAEWSGRDLP